MNSSRYSARFDWESTIVSAIFTGRVPYFKLREEVIPLFNLEEDHRPRFVTSASEAEEVMKEHIPLLIFCDTSMPGKSGLELVQEIRFKNYQCAVVMLTAHSEKERIIEALRLGAVDYLIKPFDTGALLASLPVWLQMGERLQKLTDSEGTETQVKRLNYMKVKNNIDRKKTG